MSTLKNYTAEELSALNSTEVRKLASQLKIKNYSRYAKTVLLSKISEALKLAFPDGGVEQFETTLPGEKEVTTVTVMNDIEPDDAGASEEEGVAAAEEEESKEDTPSETTPKSTKDAPRVGSKSEKILEALKKGDKSIYKIAQDFDTYYSVVSRVSKRYLNVEK